MTRPSAGLWPMIGLFGLLLVLLYLLSDASHNAARFQQLYIVLLLLSSLFLLSLLILIGLNLVSLIRNVVSGAPGSRITLRMMTAFIVFALAPASIVYVFSIQMLGRGIDSWFDVRVENALVDALELSRASLDFYMRAALQKTEPMARKLSEVPNAMTALSLSDIDRASDALELTVLGNDHRIVASSGVPGDSMFPRLPSGSVLRLVSQGDTYVGLDPQNQAGLQVRVVTQIPATRGNPEPRLLLAMFPVSSRIGNLGESVEAAFSKYNELVYLRSPLKQSFVLTLSLVLLLAVLFAVWAAFYSAQRLMAPIRDLAMGTRAVAKGEYHQRLPVGKLDDLGMLLLSFNQMTEQLSKARDAADKSQRLVERQRASLQTILDHLSSGVISLDDGGVLRTVNLTAGQILNLELDRYLGRRLEDLGDEHPMLRGFYNTLDPHLGDHRDWREQIELLGPTGRKILVCGGVALPSGGQVVVFDDVTALIQAQRDAAWAEVARRLAHEIKNPLTPIQLSAERLQRKLLPNLEAPHAEVLCRSTNTIVQQVKAMKSMVNAFAEYARTPAMDVRPLDFNKLIHDIAEMYHSNSADAEVVVHLDPAVAEVEVDAGRIRQLVHNLIKNALEALEGRAEGVVDVSTRCIEDSGCQFVELEVADNGTGIPEDLMEHLFEPYVTSKVKGNGLGLAIVKKIAEENGGVVWADSVTGEGAKIRVRLQAAVRPGNRIGSELRRGSA